MKSWHLLAAFSATLLIVILHAHNDSQPLAEAETVPTYVPPPSGQTDWPTRQVANSTEQNTLPTQETAKLPTTSVVLSSDTIEPVPDPASNTATLSLSQVQSLLEQASEELLFEQGASAHNLMILKDLATRLNDAQAIETTVLQQMTEDWPEEVRDMLSRLTKAQQAEVAFQQNLLKSAGENPQDFRAAFLQQQLQILGPELYKQLHAEDPMQIDEAGLSAHFVSANEAPSIKSEAHQHKLTLLKQWQEDELSETDLRAALSDSLDPEEINQLIDTGSHEAAWLSRLDDFLHEYRCIEQSGIVGDDELQLRRELIEKHFQVENREIVNQFLFGALPTTQ